MENEPTTSDSTDLNGTIEIYIPRDECKEDEIEDSDILGHNNVIILGKYAPRATQNDSVQEKRSIKRISAKEKDENYDIFGDNDKIYKEYRLRKSVNKPNYKIPLITDLPEIKEKPPTFRPDATMFPCPYCNKENENETELRNHIRSIHNIKYTCSQCFETFESNEKLISHKEIHEIENPSYICHTCKVAFSNRFDYLVHMFIQHTHTTTFKCVECGLTYKRNRFNEHMITHFKRAHSCSKCSKKFQTEMQLKYHLDNHYMPTKKFQCVECDKILSNKRKYDYHMTIHIGLKPHQCLYCGKGFRTSTQKNVHTRIHTQERRYACTKCDRKFIQSKDLKLHLIRHDKVKNYKCEICQKKYITKITLKNHMQYHWKKYDCPECGKSFPTITNLRNHALYKHSTEKPIKCKTCNKSFATNPQIYKHKSTKAHKRQEFRLKLERETKN